MVCGSGLLHPVVVVSVDATIFVSFGDEEALVLTGRGDREHDEKAVETFATLATSSIAQTEPQSTTTTCLGNSSDKPCTVRSHSTSRILLHGDVFILSGSFV